MRTQRNTLISATVTAILATTPLLGQEREGPAQREGEAKGTVTGLTSSSSSDTSRSSPVNFKIEKQTLSQALMAFSQQALRVVTASSALLEGKTSPAIEGQYAPKDALEKLLQGTGLRYIEGKGGDLTVVSATTIANAQTTSYNPSPGTGEGGTTKWGVREDGKLRLAQAAKDSSESQSSDETQSNPPFSSDKNADDSSSKPLQEIVITGTHIRGVAPVGSPLIVIDREAIQASGHGRVQDFLATLPQQYIGSASELANLDNTLRESNYVLGTAVDLRGLGASSTLVLINGRRQPGGGTQGGFVDVSSIATAAVDRIEVLTDGASSLYGSDAIGGVVNFILRQDYSGIEATGRISTFDGAAEEYQSSVLGGNSWESGNVLAAYQYSRRDAYMNADSYYGRFGGDMRKFGGLDFRRTSANPGTILDPATFLPAYAIPAGQDGTALTVADLIPGANFKDGVSDQARLPEQVLHSAYLTLTQRFGDRLELFAEGRYGKRSMTLPSGGDALSVSVPAANPFYLNPFENESPGTVAVDYDFRGLLGVLTQTGDVETYTASAGGIAHLGHEWALNTTATYGREVAARSEYNVVDFAAIETALADPNPATALNVFGDGSGNNPLTIDAIRGSSWHQGTSTISAFTAVADGPLLQLPAGAVKLALGIDYRDESLSGDRLENGVSSPRAIGTIDRQVKAGFAELVFPLIADVDDPAERVRRGSRLSLSLAGRYEDYSDFGSTFDPKVGIDFVPIRGVKLRGSWGTSFRAPRFNEISPANNPARVIGESRIRDPRAPTGFSNVILVFGSDPNLAPETADVWTAGFDLAPEWLRGLTVSVTWFNVDYEGKIARGGASGRTLLFEDTWAPIITRNPSQAQIDAVCATSGAAVSNCQLPGVAAIVDLSLVNLSKLRVRGTDFDVGYVVHSHPGKLILGFGGTYTHSYDRAVSATSPFVDARDTVPNPLSVRMRATATWSSVGNWSMQVAVNHAGDYRDLNREVSSWTTVDLGGSYGFRSSGWLDGTAVRLNAVNLLDREPPFVNTTAGFDAANASDVGRSVSLMVTKAW